MQDRRTKLVSRVLRESREQASGNLSQTGTWVLWFCIHGAGLIQKEDGGNVLFSPGVLLSIVIHKDGGAEQTV